MSIVTPTITTADPHEYRTQMNLIASYAEGVHLDFADGIFAPTELLPLEEAWREDQLITHAHIMYQDPLSVIEEIMHLEADLVILHAESDNVKKALEILVKNGTRTGVALLPETSLAELDELEIDGLFEHVLVFGGHLGYQGGSADLSQLEKVKALREKFDDIEIAWDGGVNEENIAQIASAGVAIINAGSVLKNARYPKKMYEQLQSLVS
jgi:ribulose-phosphate 3-epimerase